MILIWIWLFPFWTEFIDSDGVAEADGGKGVKTAMAFIKEYLIPTKNQLTWLFPCLNELGN